MRGNDVIDLKKNKMFAIEQETGTDTPLHEIRASLYVEEPTAQGLGYNANVLGWFRAKRTSDGYAIIAKHLGRLDVGTKPHDVAKAWFSEQRGRLA